MLQNHLDNGQGGVADIFIGDHPILEPYSRPEIKNQPKPSPSQPNQPGRQ